MQNACRISEEAHLEQLNVVLACTLDIVGIVGPCWAFATSQPAPNEAVSLKRDPLAEWRGHA